MKTSSKVLWSTIVCIFIVLSLVDITQANSYNLQRLEISHHNKNIVGDGNMISKTVPLNNVQTINIIGNYKIIVNTGNQSSLTVTTEDNILPNIDIDTTNRNLYVGTKPGVSIYPSQPATLSITISDLKNINLVGESSFQELDINNKQFTVNSTGNNIVILSGKTNRLNIKTIGASNLQANNLLAQNVNINSVGNSDISVHANKNLVINMIGKNNILYSGNPHINKNAFGEGNIRAL